MDSKQLEKRKKVLLDLMNDKIYVPMKIKELAIILQVSKEERPDLELVLNELLAEGKIEISKRGKYKIAKEKTVTGTFVTHPKGFGFIEVEGRDDDIYVSEENIGNAFYGDVVQATLISGTTGKRQEGRITQVISHTVTEVVGIYEQSKHFGFVIPDNQKILQDIFIPQECAKGAVNGHKVIAEITSYGSNKKKPEGRITKIIGHISDPGTDVLSIVYAKDLPFEFPEKVLNQAERVKDEVSEADMQGRLDLRKVPMVTIDGEDAKDLDDAVSLEKDGNIWHLGVHIADVTNYVQENSALDWEAKKRGTSVYLVDRVIPMLPRRLSNGICSLNAGCDRLALSCLMDIDEKGKVIGSQIAETVICVDQRMTYTSVKKILEDQDAEEIEKYALHDGELLMTEGGDRDKLGRGTVWHGEIVPCIHQNHVFAVETDESKLLVRFFDYVTSAAPARTYFDLTAKKTTNLACTNSTTILSYRFALPPIAEQQEIVEYLDSKCVELDALIAKKEQYLVELENYKKSLIYEYVTGKKEVPEN